MQMHESHLIFRISVPNTNAARPVETREKFAQPIKFATYDFPYELDRLLSFIQGGEKVKRFFVLCQSYPPELSNPHLTDFVFLFLLFKIFRCLVYRKMNK